MLLFRGFTLAKEPDSVDSSSSDNTTTIYIPTNGQLCKRCGDPKTPAQYKQVLEDFFRNPDVLNSDLKTIQESVKTIIESELQQLIFLLNENGEDDSDVSNKIEGFKILQFEVEKFFGPKVGELINNALIDKLINFCVFKSDGKICTHYESEQSENGCVCKKMTLEKLLKQDIFFNGKNSKIFEKLNSPSEIESKLDYNNRCSNSPKPNYKKLTQVKHKKNNSNKYCGIFQSKVIKEFIIESLHKGISTSFIGAKDSSYKCRNVYLNIFINPITKTIEVPKKTNAFESYVIYPDGYQEYFDPPTLTEILETLAADDSKDNQ